MVYWFMLINMFLSVRRGREAKGWKLRKNYLELYRNDMVRFTDILRVLLR